jgi:DNA-binding MarR family transcriptional regulator
VKQDLTAAEYRALAEFRHQIRRFLRYSEEAARARDVEPQQHQLLLAIKGLPDGAAPTIHEIAERLQIRHHSAVELINRLCDRGAITRGASAEDRREVRIRLTAAGERLLRALSVEHQDELHRTGPELMHALSAVLKIKKEEKRAKAVSKSGGRAEKVAGRAGTGAG